MFSHTSFVLAFKAFTINNTHSRLVDFKTKTQHFFSTLQINSKISMDEVNSTPVAVVVSEEETEVLDLKENLNILRQGWRRMRRSAKRRSQGIRRGSLPAVPRN